MTIDTNKLDELWNDFCSDKPVAAKASQPDANQSTKATITKQYDFAGEIVLINETVDANQTKSIDDNDQQAKKKKMMKLFKSQSLNTSVCMCICVCV